jgi:general secretion pathway protein G
MRLRQSRHDQFGFTFVELVMTLAILGVLVLVSVPMAQVTLQRQKEHELRSALAEIREAIDAYKRAAEQGRILQKIGDNGYPARLEELVEGVVDQRSVLRQPLYFLRRLPADPFYSGSPTDPANTWGLRSYASSPEDPRPGRDVFDVYSASEKIGLNGVPYWKW